MLFITFSNYPDSGMDQELKHVFANENETS